MVLETYFGEFLIGRILIQRSLALIYLLAFIAVLQQFPALLGEQGLLPVPVFLKQVSFGEAPSLFQWHYSDRFLVLTAWAGILLSAAAVLGLPEKGPAWVSTAVWLTLWLLYLSVVNVGQIFYGFGWESMLLEAGFFAAFLGPSGMKPSLIPVLILRWMLFRVELGAGLIKLRSGGCWHDLTCLVYHHETQPMANPLSWYFHHLPVWVHKAGVVFSHFVQLVVPFALFGPKRVAAAAGALIIAHQMLLIVSGNYAWLNWLTVILAFSAFSDSTLPFLKSFVSNTAAASGGGFHLGLMIALAGAVILLSVQPVMNLLSRHQKMNFSFNPLHLVNTYGAFGSVTQKRYEIVLEGTQDAVLSPLTEWKEYGFKAKPVDLMKRPPQFAPYHLRLDWMVWFLPFRVQVSETGIRTRGYPVWYVQMIRKLLEGDAKLLRLFGNNPFPQAPPRFVRARFYLYRFTSPEERKQTGAWWKRTLIDDYMPPVNRSVF